MKKIISIILAAILTITSCITVSADDNLQFNTREGKKLFYYLQEDNYKYLIWRRNYGYMTFIENFKSNALSLYLLKMTDTFIDTGIAPDKQKYIEILINIIATSDLDKADEVAEQKKLDNQKALEDYAMDCIEMGKNAVSVITGSNPSVNGLEKKLSKAIDGLEVLSENTDNWINSLSDLETLMQDYSEYDEFLQLVEEEGDGELKDAAQILRKNLKTIIEIKLDTYKDVSDKNFKNYEELLFSDAFFSSVKNLPGYEKDDSFKFFVDAGKDVLDKAGTLKDAWDLGTMIGTLVGDVVVGGENLINRVLEMMAIYDISEILQDKLLSMNGEFFNNIGTDREKETVNSYVALSNFLIGCRIRGEYCLYSIIANDAGLLSWFNKESAEEAKEWYEMKTGEILKIQNDLIDVITEKQLKEISNYIDSLDAMIKEIGGTYSDEAGEYENWIIGDNTQYGNYYGSTSVDAFDMISDKYSLFNIYVDMGSKEAETLLIDDGWDLIESTEKEYRFKKDDYNLSFAIEKYNIVSISFKRDKLHDNSFEPVPDETPDPEAVIAGDPESYFINFLNSSEYLNGASEWNAQPTEYAMLDINQDGVEELILNAAYDDDFSTAVVFKINMSCYDLKYSQEYKALVYSDTRPSVMETIYGFYVIQDGNLTHSFSVEYGQVYGVEYDDPTVTQYTDGLTSVMFTPLSDLISETEPAENNKVELSGFLNDFASLQNLLQGTINSWSSEYSEYRSAENGGIQYAKYNGSQQVDYLVTHVETGYQIYGVYVGQDVSLAKDTLSGSGWALSSDIADSATYSSGLNNIIIYWDNSNLVTMVLYYTTN